MILEMLQIVNTHLVTADLAFQPIDVKPSPPAVQVKFVFCFIYLIV